MACKAFVSVTGFVPNNGEIAYDLVIANPVDGQVALVRTADLDPATGAIAINAGIKAAVSAYAATNWGVTFGLLDTILLAGGVQVV